LFSKNTAKHLFWKQLGIATTVGILVSAPWHIYMTVLHGNGDPLFFLSASAFWERSISGIEGNVKPLEVFYYVNQLFVLFPAGVIWFVSGLWSDIRERKKRWLLLAIWFAVFFVIFSLMRTKLAVYLLPMLVPASLIAARGLWKATTGEISRKAFALLFGSSLLSLLWASSQSWRNEVKNLLLLRIDSETLLSLLPFVILAVALVATSYIISKWEEWAVAIKGWIIQLLIVPSVLLSAYHVFFIDSTKYNDGGKQLAAYIQQQRIDRFVVAGYERNPQLSYYLDGADIGWRDDITFKRLLPPNDSTTFETWLLHETLNEPPTVLLVLEKDKFIRYQTINPMRIIPPDYELVLSTRRYACFQKIKNNYLADNEK
jgi:4-amino-4-deoxy-L-arabinose transferase-like glycosyltransferase